MTPSIHQGKFLRALKGKPFLKTATSNFYLVQATESSISENDIEALHQLVANQTISFFEYIEESKVIVIETESRTASRGTETCLNQRRRSKPVGHIWPRTSVYCMESS